MEASGKSGWTKYERVLERYVRTPLKDLLTNAPLRDALPDLNMMLKDSVLTISINGEKLVINRANPAEQEAQDERQSAMDVLPDDADLTI